MSAADDLVTVARVVASLVVVLAVVALVARFARRAGVAGQGAGLRVVDRAGLSREAAVAVVEVAGKAFVVGVTPHRVSVLTELDAQELAAAREADPPPVRRTPLPLPRGGGADRPAPASGSVLSPRTWRQGLEALRDLTARSAR